MSEHGSGWPRGLWTVCPAHADIPSASLAVGTKESREMSEQS